MSPRRTVRLEAGDGVDVVPAVAAVGGADVVGHDAHRVARLWRRKVQMGVGERQGRRGRRQEQGGKSRAAREGGGGGGTDIIAAQSAEIEQMAAWLCEWYDVCRYV
jgi:hypothetical protein